MSDSSARLEALNPEASFIVEAPAGSGKTDLLVKRFLRLLDRGQRPQEILAITFTRKAAHEMKERILTALADRSDYDLNGLRDSLQIMTIDSFCRLIVSQAPLQSPVLTATMLEDEGALRHLFYHTLLKVIADEGEGAADFCALFQYFDNQLVMVSDLLFDLLKSREEWLPIVLQAKQQGDVVHLQKTCMAQLAESAWQEWLNLEPACYRQALGEETNLQAIANRLLTQKDEPRKALKEPIPPQFLAFLIKVRRLPCWQEETDSLLPILLRVLPLAAAYLQLLMAEHQWTDFHEIALAAVHLLEDETAEVLQRLDAQIRHVLVDEFQDTSNLQFRLLTALTASWQPDEGRTLFLVGDPKQSIYGFRHANVGLFLQARAEGISQIQLKPLVLHQNFRSDERIIQFINEFGESAFPEEADPILGKVCFVESHAEQRFPEASGVQQHFFADELSEAEDLVRRIQALQQGHAEQKIAVLVRARSHLTPIIAALDAAGVVYQLKESPWRAAESLLDDLIHLVYSVQHLGHRLAWMTLLRSPLCGLLKADLLEVARQSETQGIWLTLQMGSFTPEAQTRIRHVVNALFPVLEGAYRDQPLYLRLQYVWQALSGPKIIRTKEEETCVRRFQQFICACQTLPAYTDFKRHWAEFDAGERVPEEAGVLLLTIHQSKGLEFDHVFLPALQRVTARSDSPLLLSQIFYLEQQFYFLLAERKGAVTTETPAYAYLKWLTAQRQEQEILRLLYVAMTRAKRSLWLSAVVEQDAKHEWKAPAKSFLKYLLPHLAIDRHYSAQTSNLQSSQKDQIPQGIWRLQASALQGLGVCEPVALQPTCGAGARLKERAMGEWIHAYLEFRARHQKSMPMTNIAPQILAVIQKIDSSPTAAWILGPHEGAESEWSFVSVNAQGEMVKNRLDRSFVFEGIRYIIDYKLTHPAEGESFEAFIERMKTEYRPQLKHYEALVRACDTRYPIRLGLYFPEWDHLAYLSN